MLYNYSMEKNIAPGGVISAIDQSLAKRSLPFLYALCTLLVAAVGFLDYASGFEISFFIFYGIPIWIAAWYIGRKPGIIIAFISLFSWFIADAFTGHQYSHPLIPYWNGLIRLGFFLFTAWTLDMIKAKLRLEELNADFDGLTGILNGRGFKKRTGILFPLIARERQPYALAFIDIDNFKQVNDTKGHAEGDRILRDVAGLISRSLRASDLVSRMGGDEFVIFLPRTDNTRSKTVLANLKTKLDAMKAANGWPIGFSIGVGVFDSALTPVDEGIRAADALMYDVKKDGKGTIAYKDFVQSGTTAFATGGA